MKRRLCQRNVPWMCAAAALTKNVWILSWLVILGLLTHLGRLQPLPILSVDGFPVQRASSQSPAVCPEDPMGKNTTATRRIPVYRDHPLSLTGPGTESDTTAHASAAVCAFQIWRHSYHFPHAMQQLYQCWSYWNLPENRAKEKVLVIPRRAIRFPGETVTWWDRFLQWCGLHETAYLEEYIETLREAANVTVTHHYDDTTLAVHRLDQGNAFYLRSPNDARTLTAAIVQQYGLQATAGCQSETRLPRVAILNRQKSSSRTLLNAVAIVTALQSELGLGWVRIAAFESATFLEQVEFFTNVDILISPHGAQLTGIPFLPACGRVLELFPAHYYYEEFFGSLADASGIDSYGLYLSDGDAQVEWEYAQTLTSIQRSKFRNVDLCPPVPIIVRTVQRMMEDWNVCCQTTAATGLTG